MIRFTADEEFDSRLEAVSIDLYNAVKVLKDEDWLYYLTEWHGREEILELLDYIENGEEEAEE